MSKVTFFCYSIDESGGLERSLSLVASALTEYNEIFIVSVMKCEKRFFPLNPKVKVVYLGNEKNIILLICKLRQFLREEKIEKLVVVDTYLSVVSLPASLGLTLVKIGWEHYSFFSNIVDKKRKISRWLVGIFFDNLVVLTQRDKANWSKKILLNAKLSVIENPTPFFEVQKQNKKFLNTSAVAIGRLRYEKGFDLLIDAWSLAKPRLPDSANLIIVGDGEEKEALQKKIVELDLQDSVFIKNFSREIEKYYEKAKIYCLSSRTEALPMVLIEALSYSCPLIAFDCYTGPREIIKQSYNGFICSEGDIFDYAERIIYLYSLNEDEFNVISDNSYTSSFDYHIENIVLKWRALLG